MARPHTQPQQQTSWLLLHPRSHQLLCCCCRRRRCLCCRGCCCCCCCILLCVCCCLHDACRQAHDARPLCIALDIVPTAGTQHSMTQHSTGQCRASEWSGHGTCAQSPSSNPTLPLQKCPGVYHKQTVCVSWLLRRALLTCTPQCEVALHAAGHGQQQATLHTCRHKAPPTRPTHKHKFTLARSTNPTK